MAGPRYPSLYQINTRIWLQELGASLGRPATLEHVPDAALDAVAADVMAAARVDAHEVRARPELADGAFEDAPLIVEVAKIQNHRISRPDQPQADLLAAFDPGRAGDETET